MSLSLGDLNDRLAVEDLIVRYANAMDSQDWDTFRSCFRPDARTTMDLVGEFESPEAVRDFYRTRFTIFAALQHFVSNVGVRLDGDRAVAQTYFVSHHVPKEGKPYTHGGTFHFDVVRDAGEWRFSSHTIGILWTSGVPSPVDQH